ncbi:MAG: PorV/PorQ family protein [Elusimicrobia bacterium]|nr:PorV/PorQ family protein [Elusimicrobiota bacterium]
MKRISLIALSIGFCWTTARAAGTTAGEFLALGARTPAMGGAGVALADDATSLYYNPAAMTLVKNQSVVLMHTAYLDSSYFSQGAYVRNLGAKGSFGANFHYFNAGSIDSTDTSGASAGSITPDDMAMTAGYGRTLGPVSVGAGLKYVKSKLVDSASTWALDLGVLSQGFLGDRLRVGGSITNLGSGLKYESEKEDLPTTIKGGAAYQMSKRVAFALDAAFPKEEDAYVMGGAEYEMPIATDWSAAGRLGYNTGTAGEVSGLTGVTFGAGLTRKGMAIDYALVPQGDLGMTHWVSLGFDF